MEPAAGFAARFSAAIRIFTDGTFRAVFTSAQAGCEGAEKTFGDLQYRIAVGGACSCGDIDPALRGDG